MTTERREAKCIYMRTALAHELEIAAAMERRSQASIVDEVLEQWLDSRRPRLDPAQQKLPAGATAT